MINYLGIIIPTGLTLFNAVMFCFIRFNDLRHLEINVKELKDTIDKYGDKIDKLSTRVARLEGRITRLSK